MILTTELAILRVALNISKQKTEIAHLLHIDDFKLKGSIIDRFKVKRGKTRDDLLLWHQK